MVFEGELAGKLHAKDDEVRTSANGIPRQNRSKWGGSTVLDLLYNDKSHSFVRIQCHAPMIAPLLNPSLIPVKGTVYLFLKLFHLTFFSNDT